MWLVHVALSCWRISVDSIICKPCLNRLMQSCWSPGELSLHLQHRLCQVFMCWQTPVVWCRTVLRPLCQLAHTTLLSPVPQLRFWLLSTLDQPAHQEDSSPLVSTVPFRVKYDPVWPFLLSWILQRSQTTRSDHDQRSRISTTVLLYIYMIFGFGIVFGSK